MMVRIMEFIFHKLKWDVETCHLDLRFWEKKVFGNELVQKYEHVYIELVQKYDQGK